MCGIAGFIDFTKNSSQEILKNCTDTLSHRGPDGSGYFLFEENSCQVGLGHRRLSIIDLSDAAAQPMPYKHWNIIFNGEMYNYAGVKNELIKLGHVFVTNSDTEVVLHAWEEWGPGCIERFIGMFAFVIYSTKTQELICFRDRAGVKPFYYYWHDGLFLFASELKAFHQHPAFKKEINIQAVQQFLQYGFIMAPLSIFKNTHKLLPGHYLQVSTEKATIKMYKYWDVFDAYNKPKLKITESEAVEETEKLLISSCKYRMVADVPVGVFLSGGYDSTLVTALLQTGQTEKLKTFTIGFNEKEHNEATYAKEVASFLGTDHTEHYCTVKEAQDIIPDIPFYCDEPFGDSSIIPTTLVSRLARKNVTVALSADAGDEVFAGYDKYTRALSYYEKINAVPDLLRNAAGSFLNGMPGGILNTVFNNTAASLKKERFAALLKNKSADAHEVMDKMLSQVFTGNQLNKLLNAEVSRPASFHDSKNELKPHLTELDKMLAIDYKTYMVDGILVKVDRATMSTSLEGREPLLDHRLAEFAAQLPTDLKLNGIVKKFLLKEIAHRHVPKTIMDRPKMGFTVPVFNWLRTSLRFYTDEYMNDASFAAHGLFKQSEINIIKKRFFSGDSNYNGIFWYLLIFQMWYKKWME